MALVGVACCRKQNVLDKKVCASSTSFASKHVQCFYGQVPVQTGYKHSWALETVRGQHRLIRRRLLIIRGPG